VASGGADAELNEEWSIALWSTALTQARPPAQPEQDSAKNTTSARIDEV
jgi:hypothetical protein